MRTWTRVAFLLVLAAPYLAAETLVLQNFTLIDGTGKAPVPNAAMVITDGRIRYVGGRSGLKAPQGAEMHDLGGKFVMPGIINLHAHLGNVKGLVQDPVNFTDENLRANLDTYARYGVTSVVSMGSDQDLILQHRAAQRNGRPDTTRIFTAFRGFTGKGGYPTLAPGMKGVPFEVETAEQAKKNVAFSPTRKSTW
jgi:dihydroorotase-like cyclic amidohydrolase